MKKELDFCAMVYGSEELFDELKKQLKLCGMNSQKVLTVKRCDKEVIVVTPNGSRALEELLEGREEKRKTYLVANDYENEKYLLELTDSQIKMVDWLKNKDMIDNDWSFTPINEIKAEKV